MNLTCYSALECDCSWVDLTCYSALECDCSWVEGMFESVDFLLIQSAHVYFLSGSGFTIPLSQPLAMNALTLFVQEN